MFKIHSHQLQVFADESRRVFEDRVFRHMHAEWPDECQRVGNAVLKQLIKDGFTKSERFGLETEENFISLMEFMLFWGADFEQRSELAWAVAILSSHEVAASLRIRQLWAMADALEEDSDG